MESFTEHPLSIRLPPLPLLDFSSTVGVSLLLLVIALVRHALLRYLKANTPSMDSNPDLSSKQGVKESRPKFKPTGRWHLTMNLRRPELESWLEVDDQYLLDHGVRSELLDNQKSAVLQCRPGSEAACTEVLELVVQNLTSNYPDQYRAWPSPSNVEMVEMVATGEVFRVTAPLEMEPLEVAARLAVEDFNVLIKGQDEHTL
jgi:hypothetical protein